MSSIDCVRKQHTHCTWLRAAETDLWKYRKKYSKISIHRSDRNKTISAIDKILNIIFAIKIRYSFLVVVSPCCPLCARAQRYRRVVLFLQFLKKKSKTHAYFNYHIVWSRFYNLLFGVNGVRDFFCLNLKFAIFCEYESIASRPVLKISICHCLVFIVFPFFFSFFLNAHHDMGIWKMYVSSE